MMSCIDQAYKETLENIAKDSSYKRVDVLGVSPYATTELVKNNNDGLLYVRKEFVFNSLVEAKKRVDFFTFLKKYEFENCSNCIDAYLIADKLVVISEYVEGSSLYEFVRQCELRNTEEATYLRCVQVIFKDISEAYKGFEKADNPLVHRDINPNNIIIGNGHASVIDFGIARCFVDGKCRDTQLFGTNGYAAPEQYGFGQTSQQSDIFSLGMLLYFCLTRKQPDNILARAYENLPEYKSFNSLIMKAVSFNPDDRHKSVQAFFNEVDAAFAREISELQKDKQTHSSEVSFSLLTNSIVSKEGENTAAKHGRVYNVLRLTWNGLQYLFYFFLVVSFVWEALAPGEIMNTKHPFLLGLVCVVLFGIPSFLSLDFFQIYKKLPILSQISPRYFWTISVVLWIASILLLARFVPEL